MAIREARLFFYEADTEAEIPASLQGPAVVLALDTGDYFFLQYGAKKKIASDAAAITAGFTGTANALATLNTLNNTALTNA